MRDSSKDQQPSFSGESPNDRIDNNRSYWTHVEDEQLCRSWAEVVKRGSSYRMTNSRQQEGEAEEGDEEGEEDDDGMQRSNKHRSPFWTRVNDHFASRLPECNARLGVKRRALETRWNHRLVPKLAVFAHCFAVVQQYYLTESTTSTTTTSTTTITTSTTRINNKKKGNSKRKSDKPEMVPDIQDTLITSSSSNVGWERLVSEASALFATNDTHKSVDDLITCWMVVKDIPKFQALVKKHIERRTCASTALLTQHHRNSKRKAANTNKEGESLTKENIEPPIMTSSASVSASPNTVAFNQATSSSASITQLNNHDDTFLTHLVKTTADHSHSHPFNTKHLAVLRPSNTPTNTAADLATHQLFPNLADRKSAVPFERATEACNALLKLNEMDTTSISNGFVNIPEHHQALAAHRRAYYDEDFHTALLGGNECFLLDGSHSLHDSLLDDMKLSQHSSSTAHMDLMHGTAAQRCEGVASLGQILNPLCDSQCSAASAGLLSHYHDECTCLSPAASSSFCNAHVDDGEATGNDVLAEFCEE